MREELIVRASDLLPAMVKVRRALHRLPETGWLEFGTAALAAGKMRDLGYTLTMGAAACSKTHRMGVPATDVLENAKRCALEAGADKELVERMEGGLTGFWADLPCGGGPGPLFALRFDMDANDISECRDPAHVPEKLGFASVRQGAMHACGHDAHVAIGLAVAEILAGVKDRLRGSLRIIFQPGEEGSRGSAPMVAAGCTKGVDYILGLHIGCSADKPGMLICGARNFLATTKWDVRFSGRAAHAGMAPNEGKNAILAACTATVNMHAIARHGAGPTRITVGKISGGQGRNIIPPNAALVMETRGATTALNSYMAQEARRILEAAAAMWDCGLAVDTVGEAPSGESSPAMVEVAMSLARTLPEFTDIQGIRDFAGTEDFTAMMSAVQAQGGQGTYLQVGTSLAAGHHNERFDIEEGSMVSAVRIACLMALEYLRQP